MFTQANTVKGDKGAQLPLYSQGRAVRERGIWRKLLVLLAACVLVGFASRDSVHRFCFYRSHGIHSHRRRSHSDTGNPAYIIEATHGAVASENEVCSILGVDTLKAGGNAVDAIVSTTLCIGVQNMFSSGIGGGGFMTVRIPSSSANTSSEVYSIDFREVAPALANTTMYVGNPRAADFGGLAVGVPGELRGLEEAHKRWGSLPWSSLVQPAVGLARGWKVSKELEQRIQLYGIVMLENPDWRAIFAPEGSLLVEGEIIRRANLSHTLAAVAAQGADAMYEGPIADAIVKKIHATGGIMTREDLANYRVRVAPSLQGSYRGKKIYTPHAPTSGGVLLHMLNLMEHYDDLIDEGRTVLNTHRYLEAMKFGFAARTKVCDPSFTDDLERIDEISTKEFGDLVFPNITDDKTHPPEYYKPIYDVQIDYGTSHSAVVDKNGMAVSLTSTVNKVFGSLVMDPITGIILNDEMADFSTPGFPNYYGLYPSPYNYPEPGKRPLSSTVPIILENEDGSFYLAIGGSGGTRIFPSVFQVILNLDWGMDVSAAIEYGRVHHQLYPLEVDADSVYSADVLDGLRAKGHNITVSNIQRIAAVVQAVMKKGDTIYAASDSRKNGIAAGY